MTLRSRDFENGMCFLLKSRYTKLLPDIFYDLYTRKYTQTQLFSIEKSCQAFNLLTISFNSVTESTRKALELSLTSLLLEEILSNDTPEIFSKLPAAVELLLTF